MLLIPSKDKPLGSHSLGYFSLRSLKSLVSGPRRVEVDKECSNELHLTKRRSTEAQLASSQVCRRWKQKKSFYELQLFYFFATRCN